MNGRSGNLVMIPKCITNNKKKLREFYAVNNLCSLSESFVTVIYRLGIAYTNIHTMGGQTFGSAAKFVVIRLKTQDNRGPR